MKKQINEIKKMQLLAGLITEGEYQEEIAKVKEVKNMPYHEIAAKVIASALENGNTDQSKLDILVTIKDAIQKKIENMRSPGSSKKEIAKVEEISGEEGLSLTPKLKLFIDKSVRDAKRDGDFEDLIDVDYFENDFIDFILEKFDTKGDYGNVSKEVEEYIANAIK